MQCCLCCNTQLVRWRERGLLYISETKLIALLILREREREREIKEVFSRSLFFSSSKTQLPKRNPQFLVMLFARFSCQTILDIDWYSKRVVTAFTALAFDPNPDDSLWSSSTTQLKLDEWISIELAG